MAAYCIPMIGEFRIGGRTGWRRAARQVFRALMAGTMAGAALLLAGRAPAFARDAAAPAGLTFVVNSSADVDDANPGDGVCATAGGVCTLRAAVQEANAHPGADTIQLQADTTYFPTQAEGTGVDAADLVISDSLTLLGAGPDSTIIDGSGVVGQRVMDITGTVVISGITIAHGSGTSFGGGLLNNGWLTLVNTHVLSNSVSGGLNDWGGGINSFGDLTVTDSLIRGNQTGSGNPNGGGIMNGGFGTLTLIRTTVMNNTTPGQGGGVADATRIVDSTFSGNMGGTGGAIYAFSRPQVVLNSTVSGNFASDTGGGVYVNFGETDLINTTVANNEANTGKSSAVGGGVVNGIGQLKLTDSLVAGNGYLRVVGKFSVFQPDDCAGAISAAGYNLIDVIDTGHCSITGSPLSGDPLLGPLQANGGPTLTQALLPGSPAIDAGDPVCTDDQGAPLTADQRGAPRPANGATATRCDLGAYEAQRLLALPLVLR